MRSGVMRATVAVLMLLAAAAASADEVVTVKRVNDGDTVELAGGRRVRYIGVNTPEIDHAAKTSAPFGLEARAFNADLVQGKAVRLEYDQERRDGHHRLLAYVYLHDGTMVNERLLLAGLAYCLPTQPNTRYAERLLAAQRSAMQAGRGMWRSWREETAGRYLGNAATHRFHAPNCREGRRVSAHNRVFFTRRWDAFLAGYAPSRECLPNGHVAR